MMNITPLMNLLLSPTLITMKYDKNLKQCNIHEILSLQKRA